MEHVEITGNLVPLRAKFGLSDEQLLDMHMQSHRDGLHRSWPQSLPRVDGSELGDALSQNARLREEFHRCADIFEHLYFPHCWLLLDENGIVLELFRSHNKRMPSTKDYLLQIGSKFTLGNTGTNAITAAIRMQREVVVFPEEHYLHSMQIWTSQAGPITGANDRTFGYIGVFADQRILAESVFPFLRLCISRVSRAMQGDAISPRETVRDLFERRLQRYDLSDREREVAMYWLMDYDYRQISKLLGISEHTVRVYIGRINAKTKVRSKASLILRMIGVLDG